LDLQAPTTLLQAWILAPLLVILASAGIGYGLGLVAGMDLRALTLPAGFLTGIVLSTVLFYVGVVGVPTAILFVLAAAAGPLYAWRTGRGPRLPPRGERAALAWGALAGLGTFVAAMAPIVGSGRSGVLGYVFNDDSAVHIALTQAIADGASGPENVQHDSFGFTTDALDSGYPLGSYAWPVFTRVAAGIDPFHIWVPVCAVTMVMIALVAFSVLRGLGAPPAYAGIAAVIVPCGHLVYSYHAQGGLKELIMPVAVYGCAALFAQAIDEGVGGRTLIPAAIAAAAAVVNLGYAGAAWIGPIALAGGALIVWRVVRGRRVANVRNLVLFAVVGVLLALPAGIKSIDFFRGTEADFTDPAEVGNLFDAISLWQILGVWLTGDYRWKPTDNPGFVYTALVLALVLAVLGLVHALRRRDAALPLSLLAGVVGAWAISSRTSIYFDAKTYVALAPAVGIATAAGVLALWSRRPLRIAGLAAGLMIAVGVAWSALMIYAHVWVTPEDRFEEYDTVAERFDGRADVTLVLDRDQYAMHFLREIGPWDDWTYRQPERGFRFADNRPPSPDRAPDLDDYRLEHVNRFGHILERKSPGGSRAPSNYQPVFETEHYRMWERNGRPVREHIPFGTDGQQSSAPLECRRGRPVREEVVELAARARRDGSGLLASVQPDPAHTVIEPMTWTGVFVDRASPAPQTIAGLGGTAGARLQVASGRYEAWIQGSFGPGARLTARTGDAGPSTGIGDVFNDLGTPGWHRVGEFDAERGTVLGAMGIGRPRVLAGSRHFNIYGPTRIVRKGATARVETIPPKSLRRLCGRHVDWIELPAK
jgi:hypothetical protein